MNAGIFHHQDPLRHGDDFMAERDDRSSTLSCWVVWAGGIATSGYQLPEAHAALARGSVVLQLE